jgi:hypothetical protein
MALETRQQLVRVVVEAVVVDAYSLFITLLLGGLSKLMEVRAAITQLKQSLAQVQQQMALLEQLALLAQ